MFRTALAEAERIEIVQAAHVAAGLLKKPDAAQLRRRDDFAGMARLIEIIESDTNVLRWVKAGAARLKIVPDAEDVVDADEAAAE